MKVPFNDLKLQYKSIKKEVDQAIKNVIETTAFINGPDVFEFERAFAEYCGGGYCAGCSNGTSALELIMQVLRIGPGDEAIVPAQSFIATIEPIIRIGAKPVFVDICPETYLLDSAKLEEAITNKTKAIVAVHLYGNPCDMDSINAIAKKYNVAVVEDAAQAHGAVYNGVKAGLLGDIAGFSFYPGKNLGAYGDAGAVVSRNSYMVDFVSQITNHGRKEDRANRYAKYTHSIIGSNYRLDTLQAAILNVKLKYIQGWTDRRRTIAKYYNEQLSDMVTTQKETSGAQAVYHLYVVEVDERDQILRELKDQGIGASIHYPDALYQHKSVKDIVGDLEGKYPHAEKNARSVISLPLFPEMSDAMIEHVVDTVRMVIQKRSKQWIGVGKRHWSQAEQA